MRWIFMVIGVMSGGVLAEVEVVSRARDMVLDAAKRVDGWTYRSGIGAVVEARCVQCHRAGGVAPFSLESYVEVLKRRRLIREVVEGGVMPPWGAESGSEKAGESVWANDFSLLAGEREALMEWIDGGCVEGEGDWVAGGKVGESGWAIGKPDAVLRFEKAEKIPASGALPYVDVEVAIPWEEDRWVSAVEIRPSAVEVVHHVLVTVTGGHRGAGAGASLAGGDVVGVYVPGQGAVIYPEGWARALRGGGKLRFQMHYTPSGRAVEDRTEIGFRFASKEPVYEVRSETVMNMRLRIPAGEERHVEEGRLFAREEMRLWSVMPHMHYRGKAFSLWVEEAGGRKRTLLSVPRYWFDWQMAYRFHEPVVVPAGATIRVRGEFDNSVGNPRNPDPNVTVRWGRESEDEMLVGYLETVVKRGVKKSENPVAEVGSRN